MIIDATCCTDHHTNDAVEDLFLKAAVDPPDIWDKHQSPFVQRLIELFTDRGLLRISQFHVELADWIDNEHYSQSEITPTKPGELERRTPSELRLVKLYLSSIPVDQFTFDDWGMTIDYLQQKYWKPDQIRQESEWLVTRSAIMGRVQANMESITLEQADNILEHAPTTVASIADKFGLTGVQSAIMDYGLARCTENIVTVYRGVAHGAKNLIMEYKKNEMLGFKGNKSDLKTQLFDKFATANTDWRRIAVTEVGEMEGQAVVASVPTGSKVRRVEQYKGACPFCRKIDGLEFEVISPSEAHGKDPWKFMWAGKNNIGLSASPRKRVGNELIDRLDSEMWNPCPGTQHPNCRGVTVPVKQPNRAGDEKFTAWMNSILESK